MKNIFTLLFALFIASSLFSSENYPIINGPKDWSWIRKGVDKDIILKIKGPPDHIYNSRPTLESLDSFFYRNEINNSFHRINLSRSGRVVSIDWFEGIGVDENAPKIKSTDCIKIVQFPRLVPLKWEVGKSPEEIIAFQINLYSIRQNEWKMSRAYVTSNNVLIHEHLSAGHAKWRVRAITKNGYGEWSDFCYFTCET